MNELVRYVAGHLVEDSASVEVREVTGNGGTVIEVRVTPADRGKLIGKEGRTIRALRVLVNAAASRAHTRASVEVVD